MRTGYASVLVCLVSSALLAMTGCGGDSPSGPPVATEVTPPTIPPGYSSKSVHVKFQEGTNVERPLEGLPPDLRAAVVSHTKLVSLPEEKLIELRAKESSRLVQTGSPQLGNTGEPIGPRTNLRQAVAQLTHGAIHVALDIQPGHVFHPHQSEKH